MPFRRSAPPFVDSETRRLSALVVDDDPQDLAALRALLGRLPTYRVDVFAATRARDGLAALAARGFDVALIDRRLDEGDAIALAEAAGGAGADAALVLMTGETDAAFEERAAAAGFVEFLHKDERAPAAVERVLRYATAARRRERALAAALARARTVETERAAFVARLSHDLRGPLNGVLGFAEMLETGRVGADDPGKVRDYAGSIATCARLCLGLVDELIAHESLAATPPAAAGEIDAVAAVREGLGALEPVAAEFGLALEFVAEPPAIETRLPPAILQRIAGNLADNALRYAATRVRVRLVAEDGALALEVRDDGPGVAPDRLAALGAPLARGSQVGRRGPKGHGLGLASVRALAEAQGGRLVLASAPTEGFTARVTLPRRL